MKKLITHSIKALALLAFLLSYTNSNAQVGNFNITVENVVQTATNKLEFDVYLLDTDPGQSFELASCQLGFLINSLISGGTISAAINNSGSGLNALQQFIAAPTVVSSIAGHPNQTLIRLAAGGAVGPGQGTIISTSGQGTLLTHFVLTSSIDFTANSTPNLTFTSSSDLTPLYATRVAEFISLSSTQLTVTPGANALVNGNPVLNPLVAPTAFTVTGGGSYCLGGGGLPVGLSDSEIGVTYTLIRNGVDQLPTVSGTGSAISFGSNLPGTYTYTVRGTNGSGSTPMLNSVIITENAIPTITGTTPGSRCGTGTVSLGASASAGTINWYAASTGGGSLGIGTSFTTPSISSTTTYYVDATNNGCTTASRTAVTATINAIPTITGTTPASRCGTGTVTLGATASAGNINWYAASTGGGSLGTGPSFTTPSISSTTTYYVDATNNGCTTGSRTGIVATVSTIITPTLSGLSTVCAGTTGVVYTTEAGQTNYIWSISAGGTITSGGTTSSNTATVTWNTAGAQSISVNYTASGGCVSTIANYPVTVNVIPAITGTTPASRCGTGTVSLGASASAGTINWYAASTGGGSLGIGTSFTTPSISSTTTYYVDATNNGCTTASRTAVTATINAIPTITGTTPGSRCGTGTVTLGATASAGNINWYAASTGGGSLGTGPSFTTPSISSTTTYYVDATNNGCTTGSRTGIVATVSTIITPTLSGLSTVCAGTTGVVYTTEAGQTNYIWSISAGGTITSGGTTSSNTATVTWNTAGAQSISVNYTTSGGCVSTITNYPVTVNTTPSAPTLGTITQPTCAIATGSVILNGLPAGNWTINPGAIAGSTSTYTITNLATGTYNYTVTNSSGCISPASASVVINTQPPTPVVNNLTASISSGQTFTVTPSGGTIPVGTTYTWPLPVVTGGITGGAIGTNATSITGTLTIPSGVGTATYTVTPTSGTCIGATFTVTVTVTSTCVGVTIGTQPVDNSMCAVSGITTFTVAANGTAPFTYQWQYNNTGTWASVVNGTPLGAVYSNATTTVLSVSGISTAGSYQYRCFITNCTGGNNATSGIATLTVNASPIPTLTSSDPDNVFCFGTSVTFTAGGGTTYNFRVNGATVQNGALTTYTTTTLANGQIVTVIVTNATGCTATSAQIQNIVNPLPLIILSTAPACSADFLTYSLGVTVGSGTVTCPSGTVTNLGGNIWSISNIPAHTNVTIKVVDSGGCENTLNITAPDCNCPVVPAPVSSGDRSYCAGGIIPALTVTVPAGGNPKTVDWYNSSSGGTILLSGSLSYTPSAAGTYYAVTREISSSCLSSTRTPVILTMNSLPVPTLTSSDADNIFCGGTSVTFTAGGGTSFNFLVGGLSRQDGVSTTYTSSTLTNGQSVVVIVTNANGCSATSASITNTVNPTPVPTLTSSDADNSFCAGTNVTFTAGGGTNYDFRVGGVSVQNGVSTTYSTNSLTNGQVVDVVVSNTYGCAATSTAITNSVFAAPVANAGTGGNNCGLGFSLNGSLNVGTGTWAKVSGPGSVSFSPDANTPTALVTVSSFGTYVFSWTVANGTCTSSANVTVIFIQQPPAEAGTGGDECDKDFIMNAVITTGVGTWTKISGPGTAVFTPDNHQPNAKVTVDQFGAYNFGWTVVNSICTSSDNVRVVFHDLPPVNAGRDTAFCKGGSMQLHAQGVGTVSWIPAALVSNPSIINPVATPDTTTTFTVNLTDQFGCKNSDNIVVEVRVKPIANAGPDQVLTYVLKTTMDATLAHSYETGVWSLIKKEGTGEFLDSTNSKTQVSKLSLGKNKFLWTVKNGYCPASSDTVMITVNDFIVPTLITPNMDGRNDYFVLRGLATLGKTELIIFDRRGTQVYRDTNYDNSWNGVDYNKNPLPSDTYFYVIKSENGISISGYIVIRR